MLNVGAPLVWISTNAFMTVDESSPSIFYSIQVDEVLGLDFEERRFITETMRLWGVRGCSWFPYGWVILHRKF